MITKNDCYLILNDLENKGIDTKEITKELINSQGIPLSVIKFINSNRELELSKFYEKIRKSYNQKKSSLYINIVKEIEEPNEVLTTLSGMLTQILLFSRQVENKQMFLKHARAGDITRVLNLYFTNYDLTNCLKLIKIIKTDIKALESIRKES